MKKIAATNDVGNDGIVDGSSEITKTMRIRACFIGRQIRIPFLVMVSRHAREFYGSRKILRLWLMRISEKFLQLDRPKY